MLGTMGIKMQTHTAHLYINVIIDALAKVVVIENMASMITNLEFTRVRTKKKPTRIQRLHQASEPHVFEERQIVYPQVRDPSPVAVADNKEVKRMDDEDGGDGAHVAAAAAAAFPQHVVHMNPVLEQPDSDDEGELAPTEEKIQQDIDDKLDRRSSRLDIYSTRSTTIQSELDELQTKSVQFEASLDAEESSDGTRERGVSVVMKYVHGKNPRDERTFLEIDLSETLHEMAVKPNNTTEEDILHVIRMVSRQTTPPPLASTKHHVNAFFSLMLRQRCESAYAMVRHGLVDINRHHLSKDGINAPILLLACFMRLPDVITVSLIRNYATFQTITFQISEQDQLMILKRQRQESMERQSYWTGPDPFRPGIGSVYATDLFESLFFCRNSLVAIWLLERYHKTDGRDARFRVRPHSIYAPMRNPLVYLREYVVTHSHRNWVTAVCETINVVWQSSGWRPFKGSVVNGCKLVRFIGDGSFGSVWMAIDQRTGAEERTVAIKFEYIKIKLKTKTPYLHREVAVYMALAKLPDRDRLRFPALYRFQFGELTNSIVLELTGRSLNKIRTIGTPMDLYTSMYVCKEALLALRAMHSNGYAHMDIGLRNVAIGRGDTRRIVLIDMGMSTSVAEYKVFKTTDRSNPYYNDVINLVQMAHTFYNGELNFPFRDMLRVPFPHALESLGSETRRKHQQQYIVHPQSFLVFISKMVVLPSFQSLYQTIYDTIQNTTIGPIDDIPRFNFDPLIQTIDRVISGIPLAQQRLAWEVNPALLTQRRPD